MQNLLLLGGILCLAAWLYLLLFHGRFWQVSRLQAGGYPDAPAARGRIAVIIPARNEAANIGRALQSLLGQSCAGSLQIYVVDDNSSDGTADAARAAISEVDSAKLHIISGRPLPPGWTGKLWAVQQGIDAAMELAPEFLLLTDADVEHAPDNVATLVSIAEREGYDLVSFMVKLHCRSLAEKLLIPAFVFFFFMLYPPLWIRSPRRRTAGAAGGCILIRPRALALAGGIVSIHHEVIDDCALARAVKRSGGRVWLGMTATHSQLSPLRQLRRNRAHDRAHRLQSAQAFSAAADWRNRRHGAALCNCRWLCYSRAICDWPGWVLLRAS